MSRTSSFPEGQSEPAVPGAARVSAEVRAIDAVPYPLQGVNAEIELKLDCDPERLDGIARAVERYQRGPEGALDLKAVYYDTPDLALLRSGSVLRVRTDGTGRVMTLKARTPENGKALERTEWMAPVAGMEPDLALLGRELPSQLFAPIAEGTLQPVFSTEVHRLTRMLETPLGVVELALDRGRIVAEGRSRAISEVELELKAGKTEAIFQLADELVSQGGLRPSIQSKSARGFDLALDRAPEPARARPIGFPRKVKLEEVLNEILRTSVQHMMESRPAAEDGRDPEGLHQHRVALRRLRSALDLERSLAPDSSRLKAFRDDARWLMAELNDARDWDVFVFETLPEVSGACPSVEGFQSLGKVADRHRHEAHGRARAAIRDDRTSRFQIGLGLWIEQKAWRAGASSEAMGALSRPARAFALGRLEDLHRRVLKRGRRFENLTPAELHRLRIAVKKLRYAADFLYPLCGNSKDFRRHAGALSRLQDELGHSNDLSVVDRLVQAITRDRIPSRARLAAGAVLGWSAGHLPRNGGAIAAWKAFRKLDLT